MSVTILEEDGKAGFQHVPTTDKDCFKLRQNTKKKVLLTISQPGSARILLVERWVTCAGMQFTCFYMYRVIRVYACIYMYI